LGVGAIMFLLARWLTRPVRLLISDCSDITQSNPLTEAATQYKKFATDGPDQKKTVFTAGYYQGVNEYFVNCSSAGY